MLNGPFAEIQGDGTNSLTLVPPAMIGPPEKIHIDMKDTTIPAIVSKPVGQGQLHGFAWELGALHYRHSLPAHAGLFRDVVDGLIPMRQLITNAHPLVQVSLMNQK